jgi:DNA-binding LytR/AlgR family response regulator
MAQRVKLRLVSRQSSHRLPDPAEVETALDALLTKLQQLQQGLHKVTQPASSGALRWIQCTVGSTTRLIDVNDVLFFRSDEKYTRIQTREQEALVRSPIRELVQQLDAQQFWQIHRSTIVKLSAISAITRDESGRQRVHIHGHPEVLEVSRSFAHLFRGS